MAKFHVPFFEGVVPKKSIRLLKDTEASSSENARVDRGQLEPWNDLGVSEYDVGSETKSITKYESGWLFWDEEGVNTTASPVLTDTFEKLYYTGDGTPKITYKGRVDLSSHEANGLTLGIPAPTTAPRMSVAFIAGAEDDSVAETAIRTYAYSLIDTDGAEGALSRPTSAITILQGQDVQIGFRSERLINNVGTDTEWTLDPNAKRRIYRIGTDSLITPATTDYDVAGAVVDTRTMTITLYHGALRTIDHIINPGDIAGFNYDGTVYTGTVGSDNTVNGLLDSLANAVDGDGTVFGAGRLTVTVAESEDKMNTVVTVKTVAPTSTLSAILWSPKSHYWVVGDVSISTSNFIDDVPPTTLVSATEGLGAFGNSGSTLWSVVGTTTVIPKPLNGPTTGNHNDNLLSDGDEDRAYVYTYSNLMGEEGPPSPPSGIFTVSNGSPINITFDDTDVQDSTYNLSAELNDAPFAFKNVYRTASGTTGTEFQFVERVDIGSAIYHDSRSTESLGEVLPSEGWAPPPVDMEGLILLPNGFLAGFSGSTLCFSEEFTPHAWPTKYQITIKEPIVAVAISGNSIVVLTEGFPYLVTGEHPQGMSAVRLETSQPCTSRSSVVDLGDRIVYASPDGLVAVGEGGTEVMTADLFTRSQWQEYGHDDLVGALYEGHYLGSSTSKSKSFLLSRNGVLTDLDGTIKTTYYEFSSDELWVVNTEGELRGFNSGTASRTLTWTSKEFRTTAPTSLSALKIVCEGSCTIKLWGDDELIAIGGGGDTSLTVTGDSVSRLPSGSRYSTFKFELSTSSVVHSITFSSSIAELADG